MATNMGTPRIYVNILEYLSAIGYTDINDVYRLNPTQLKDNFHCLLGCLPLKVMWHI